MNDLAYFQAELSPYFPPLPVEKALSCKHLPMAIIGGRPEEEIDALIDKCRKTVKKKFSQLKDITTLHLAALFGRDKTILSLCSRVSETLPKDTEGNTPLHFRALTASGPLKDDPFYQSYSKGCHLNHSAHLVKNNFWAIPDDLVDMIQRKDELSFRSHQSESKKQDPLALVELSDKVSIETRCLDSKIHYVDQVVASSQALFDQWLYGEGNAFLSSTNLPIKPIHRFLIKQIPGKGCGLVAQEDIPSGTPLFAYSGELVSTSRGSIVSEIERGTEYLFLTQKTDQRSFKINAAKYRSAAAYVNDGVLTNVLAFHEKQYTGLKDAIYFFSDGIKEGQELTVDYSDEHPIKYHPNYSISEEELNKLKKLFKEEETPFEEVFGSFQNQATKIYFNVIKTPLVLFRLVADGAILPKQFARLLIKKQANKETLRFAPQLFIAYSIAKSKEILESKTGGAAYFRKIINYLDLLEDHLKYSLNIGFEEKKLIYLSLFFESFSKLYQNLRENIPLEEALANFDKSFRVTETKFDLQKKAQKFSTQMNLFIQNAFPDLSSDSNIP